MNYTQPHNVTPTILDECFELLHKNLYSTNILLRKPYYMPKTLYNKINNKRIREKYFNELFINMLNYAGIPYEASKLKIINMAEHQESAGNFHKATWNSSEITLNYNSSFDTTTIVAILAHEISHLFLNMRNIKFDNTLKNELLTDICAIYLGFERYMFLGYEYKTEDFFLTKYRKVRLFTSK